MVDLMENKKSGGVSTAVWTVFLIIVLLALDQYTKLLAVQKLEHHADYEFLKGILSFTYLENSGAAWGMMQGKIPFFILFTAVFVLLILAVMVRVYHLQVQEQKTIYFVWRMDACLLIAGALGNLIDRIARGYVVDFIKTDFMDFPVFNVADCYVTVAVAVLIILVLFFTKEEEMDKIFSLKQQQEKKQHM
jgi:signal peptidase II